LPWTCRFARRSHAPVAPWRKIEHCNQPLAAGALAAILDRQPGDRSMARGTVKWFNSQKGYGFIQPQAGGKDVFVHISAVEKAGLSSLNEGQVVEYEEVPNKGKTSAENLKVQR
jgi:CspA family cold shock protein